ncbi:MAG: 50S ribosomal protein L9 [Deltaproteobacteria bacterium]|nr:50S ribosomal protein L9 [Deltaproteobacteria bacterium]
MKLILQEDVPNLGVVGDLVNVRDGYGRNYLIPQGKAILASRRSVAELDHQKRLAAKRREKAVSVAADAKKKVESLTVVMQARVAPAPLSEAGVPMPELLPKLFGTITSRDIAKVLRDSAAVTVDHRRVSFDTAVRTVGKFEARIRLDGGVTCALPFWVVPEGSADIEAEKKRVEASQAEVRRAETEALAAARAEEAAAKAEFKASREKAEKDKVEKDAAVAAAEAAAAEGEDGKAKKKPKKPAE